MDDEKVEEGLKPIEPKKVIFDDKKFEENHEKAVNIVQEAVQSRGIAINNSKRRRMY